MKVVEVALYSIAMMLIGSAGTLLVQLIVLS